MVAQAVVATRGEMLDGLLAAASQADAPDSELLAARAIEEAIDSACKSAVLDTEGGGARERALAFLRALAQRTHLLPARRRLRYNLLRRALELDACLGYPEGGLVRDSAGGAGLAPAGAGWRARDDDPRRHRPPGRWPPARLRRSGHRLE